MKITFILLIGIILGFLAFKPITTYDSFFGLKIGEEIIKTGQIPSKEIFSWSAYGRSWVAYEWMPQTMIYLLNTIGGFKLIQIYVSGAFILLFLLNFVIFYRIIQRDFVSSLLFSIFLCASIYEFFVARPQIISYILFPSILGLTFLYILRKKDLLLLSLPLTYIWANSHASFIFSPFLFLSFGLLTKSKKLLVFGILNILVTVFPPLYLGPYRLLWDFTKDIKFLSDYLTEWAPLSTEPAYLYLYIILVILSLVTAFRTKNILTIPLFAILFASCTAVRHIPNAVICASFIWVLTLPKFSFKKSKLIFTVAMLLLILISSYFLYQKRSDALFQKIHLDPLVSFLNKNHVEGHMYNDFAMGGYLIYGLYPKYQVFFDGRADIYHNIEARDFWDLVLSRKISKDTFKNQIHKFLDRYNFSFLVIGMDPENPLNLSSSAALADILMDDQNWSLLYFDDYSQILVKNNKGFSSITPFRLIPYKGSLEKAAKEYEEMLKIQPSNIAYMNLQRVYAALNK